MKLETPNCYPRCSNSDFIRNLKMLNPCIDLSILYTSFPFEDFGKAKKLTTKLIDIYKGNLGKATSGNNNQNNFQIETTNEEGKTETIDSSSLSDGNLDPVTQGSDKQVELFHNLYGFISLMSAHIESFCLDIPIFSSPQIRINNGNGWKKEQSLFGFIQSIINGEGFGSIIGSVLGKAGKNTANLFNSAMNGLETLGGMAGWSPRVSPFFSLKDNPFGSVPTLQVNLTLINDCENSVKVNADFLNAVVRKSLISSHSAKNQGTSTSNDFWMRWTPPKLFNVGLKFGSNAKSYVKRYHLCTLEASVEPKGVMRKGIPDVYEVTLTFSSIMPDTLDMWTGNDGAFPTLNSSSSSASPNITTVAAPDTEAGNDTLWGKS